MLAFFASKAKLANNMFNLQTRLLITLTAIAALSLPAQANNPIHVTYLWHMHQPIYYPYESVNQTDSFGRFNFSVKGVHDQRLGAYGEWPKNAVQQGTDLPNAGVQVSFSGSLMENMSGLYGNGWREHYRWGRNGLRTSRNNPRLDLVGIAYHHSLMPLTTKESMRMQIRLHKEAYRDVWNTGGSYSKGFWPPECAFDVNMIPALVEEGIEWVIVDNGHFDRACQGYPWAPASSIRPNKADQLNPNPTTIGSQWVQLNNVWAPTKVSAPWGYQPHYVQYIDPWSNPANPTVKKIIAVPAGRYEGNENGRGGYGAFKPENVWGSHIALNNNSQRPMLLLCHSDGDNYGMLNADAYNGQHGNFLNMVRNNPNFSHTSVQDYLELYPVPVTDVIHVEPGSWVGIDGGTPFYDKWRENNARDGEHPDLWSWSVLIAAANRVIHADNLENNYSMNDIRWGIGPDTAKAWHYYLQAETSCHWYWDFDRANPWDGNATRGANLAIAEANKVIARHPGIDHVGPTIWPPQRDIYNPGGKHYNETNNQPSNFTVFTFVDDVSGLQSVKLYWRTDNDGQNPINEYDNELYAHNPLKNSPWNIVTMTADWYPTVKGPQVPDPANRAQRYQASINGQSNVLIDYFVEAIDNKGNISRSDIEQVFVENGNAPITPPPAPSGLTATAVSPNQINLTWPSSAGATSYLIKQGTSQVGTTTSTSFNVTGLTPSTSYTFTVIAVNTAGQSPASPSATATTLPPGATPPTPFTLNAQFKPGYLISHPGMRIYAAIRGTKLYVATWTPAGGGNDHFILISDTLLPTATTAAPWAKAGLMAQAANKPFLASESTSSNYIGWFNAPVSSTAMRGSTAGQAMEGVIDLVEAFGTVPPMLYIAALAYGTNDGASLAAQAPARQSGNGNNIAPNDYLAIPTASLVDMDTNDILDYFEPGQKFHVHSIHENNNACTLGWNAVPDRSYRVQWTSNLSDPQWQTIANSTVRAATGQSTATFTHIPPPGSQGFYRVELIQP
jgi:chitodextrinase